MLNRNKTDEKPPSVIKKAEGSVDISGRDRDTALALLFWGISRHAPWLGIIRIIHGFNGDIRHTLLGINIREQAGIGNH